MFDVQAYAHSRQQHGLRARWETVGANQSMGTVPRTKSLRDTHIAQSKGRAKLRLGRVGIPDSAIPSLDHL